MVSDQHLEIPTLGYKLQQQQDDDTWHDIYEALNDPNALETTVYGLTTHKLYRFRVFALDFNGLSQPSTVFEIYACGLPMHFAAPTYVWSTQTTIEI